MNALIFFTILFIFIGASYYINREELKAYTQSLLNPSNSKHSINFFSKIINKVIYKLVLMFISYCEKRNKIEHITGHGSTDTYLLRYQVVKSRHFNFYIHRILRSDYDVPHDHPWDFFTYMVAGSYSECRYEKKNNDTELICSVEDRPTGTFAFRKAHAVHKLVVKENLSVADKDQAPLTLFMTGPHQRTWGFWPGDKLDNGNYINAKFLAWKKYLKLE